MPGFGAPEIRTGGPYIPAVWPWVVGMTKARELLYTGNLIDAEEAKRLDLVNEVVPVEELDAAVERQVATIAKLPLQRSSTIKSSSMPHTMMRRVPSHRAVYGTGSHCPGEPRVIARDRQFDRSVRKTVCKAALSWNAERFVDEDAWFKKSRERG